MNWKDNIILLTGGTGSFGRKFTEIVFKKYKPKKLIIFSRDEYKQSEMAKTFPASRYPIRYFLGDIRDKDRLCRAFYGVDYVVHAAALKQVPALEYNPTEAVKTNIVGANNIVDAAIDMKIKKVVTISTDKAVNPINLYGATKLVAEKIFVAANAYSGRLVKFCVVRYGNVMGSRGSVVPLFLNLKSKNIKDFPLTDENMTRFWITLEQGVNFDIKALEESVGGEIFVPKINSNRIIDLARAIEPECKFNIIGIRQGEKIHETLISEDEIRNTKIVDGSYVILSQFYRSSKIREKYDKYPNLSNGFVYKSDKRDEWLTVEQLRDMLREIGCDV